MINKEQIAHDLTIIYLKNRYCVDVTGNFYISSLVDGDISGSGSVTTEHLPRPDTPRYQSVKTGEKGFFGIEKKKQIQVGYMVDSLFNDMVVEYYQAFERFLRILEKR